jgi:methyltransferase (TIGR00027 family)
VFEIDQPEVISFKSQTLADLGAAPTADRRAVAVDLRNDWPAALREAGFDPSKPSAWIAEGLFGYLPPEAQDRLLDAVTELAAPGSRLASEAVPTQPSADLDAAREKMREATDKWREHGFDLDFEELGYPGDRNDVGEYLGRLGWTSVGQPMGELIAETTGSARSDDALMTGVTYYTSTYQA